MFHTFGGAELQSFFDRFVEGSCDTDVEAAADKGQTERLGGELGQANADTASDAFAGLEDDSAWLHELRKFSTLLAVTTGVGTICLSIRLQGAVTGGAAVTVQATRGLGRGFSV